MACDPKQAALALHRFGFGPRAGTIEAIAADPRGALLAELELPGAGQIANSELPSGAAANRAVFEYNAERAANDKRKRKLGESAAQAAMQNAGGEAAMEAKSDASSASAKPEAVPLPRQLFRNEAKAHFDTAINAETGLGERLVWFWSNHFCVNGNATVMAGGYEREAIRPHVLGRFGDMLLAAESHPAMLLYLDNAQSIGPDSVAGINRDKGINENLGREILELHTLGVRTVYTQADVTNFAKILTGWTIRPPVSDPDHGGEFMFLGRTHQPGPEIVIDNTYPDTGVQQGRSVLADLARHPATARHIATKLARHFVADDPPTTLVERLTQRFLDTDGDLKEVTKTLITSPEPWELEQNKIKRPGEWLVAMLRATGESADVVRILRAQALLGEPLWRPPAPKGFSDDNAAWIDGMGERLDIANSFAHREGLGHEPEAVLEAALGPLASADTRHAVTRAESRPQALTLLVMAPEFQRR
jgi:uncharacterized protein (DUF1800 family)